MRSHLLILFVVLFWVAGTASGAVNVSSCTNITAPGVYLLNTTIANSTLSYCILINTSDVIFDGQGNLIDGSDAILSKGIWVELQGGSLTNVTIRNVVLTDWASGILAKSLEGGRIENCSFSSNSGNSVHVLYTNNTVIANSVANSNFRGLYVTYSNNNTFVNITVTSSSSSGVYIYDSLNNILENVISSSSVGDGIYLRNSNGTIIKNSTVVSNSNYGVNVYLSHNTSITMSNISRNNNHGIAVTSHNTTIINTTISSNNAFGIYLAGEFSTIRNNTIAANAKYGIYVVAKNNLIYNNFFNNSKNAYVDLSGGGGPNSWNTTKTSGTNIIGGMYLGGNYWGTPSGNGFSDTCTDANSDEICDTPYTINTSNVDYLPLSFDKTPPNITVISPKNRTYGSSTVLVNVSVVDSSSPISSVVVEINSSVNVSLSLQSGYYVGNITLSDGQNSIRIYANDTFDNLNVSRPLYFTVDSLAPNITVSAPAYILQYLGGSTVNFSLSDAHPSHYTLFRNGSLVSSGSYSSGDVIRVSVPADTIGVWNFTLVANDTLSHTAQRSVLVRVVPASAEINKSITGAPITINETIINTTATFLVLPDVNNGTLTLKARFSRNASELVSSTTNSEFVSYASAVNQKSPNIYLWVNISGDVNSTTLRYVVIRVGYTTSDLDMNGDGDAADAGDIDEKTLTLWRYCSATDVWQVLRKGNLTCGNETVTVFDSGVNVSGKYVWANLSALSLFAVGGAELKSAVASAGDYSPEVVILANKIDLTLAADFVSHLRQRGIKLYIVDARNFSDYTTKQYVVILGGHRAYDGVGDIVKGIMSDEEKGQVEGGRVYIKKRSVFRSGQVVYIFAGRDRYETAEAWREVYKEVAREIEYNWG
jgi:hypothetical protein